jgi:hypothetical protein
MGDILMSDYAPFDLNQFENIGFYLRLKPSKSILGRDGYIVAQKFAIIDDREMKHIFEEGYESDGGTIPWWLRPMFPSGGRALPAYLIHDKGCDKANETGKSVHRQRADDDFYRNLRGCGYAKWRARLMSSAVNRYGELLKATGELK